VLLSEYRKLSVTKVQSGETFEEEVDVVITARGQLNNISWPDIPGLGSFQGKVMHSSDWDARYELVDSSLHVFRC
jgi:cation diffusion facilitator CzcD-associated flavoprotein CzcO